MGPYMGDMEAGFPEDYRVVNWVCNWVMTHYFAPIR